MKIFLSLKRLLKTLNYQTRFSVKLLIIKFFNNSRILLLLATFLLSLVRRSENLFAFDVWGFIAKNRDIEKDLTLTD